MLRSDKYTKKIEWFKQEFQRRFCDFPSHESEFMLFSDPFQCNPENAPTNKQLEIIELQESSNLKSSFHDLPLHNFYSLVPDSTYPNCVNMPPEWLLFLEEALTLVKSHFQS